MCTYYDRIEHFHNSVQTAPVIDKKSGDIGEDEDDDDEDVSSDEEEDGNMQ